MHQFHINRAVAQLVERRGSEKAKAAKVISIDGDDGRSSPAIGTTTRRIPWFETGQRDHIPFKRFEIRWGERIGLLERPYMRRWVLTLFGYSIRLHHWTASDDQRHLHDHAWWMLIIVLCGGYRDISTRTDRLSAGSIRFRRAEHRHTVLVNQGGCWSLLVTGQPSRNWGFYVPGRERLLRPLRYFSRFGHHPCL